jgi:hypothetical protein
MLKLGTIVDAELAGESLREWEEASAFVLARLDQLLLATGRSNLLRSYVRNLKGYPRVMYLTAAWVPERAMRFALGTAFCLHVTGLKLLDDIVDADQDIDPRELVVGHVFCDDALQRIHAAAPDAVLLADFDDKWLPILRHVFDEPETEITHLRQWEEGARLKSGRWIARYGEAACRGCGRAELAPLVGSALEAIGVLYTISDDVRDFREMGETRSNLAALVAHGKLPSATVADLIDRLEETMLAAVQQQPPSFQFFPRVEMVLNKCRRDFGRSNPIL